jgi:hypothetical protein
MAEWCNARLVVAGRTSEVKRFRRLASVPVAGLRVMPLSPRADARASRLFRGDMLVGEAQGLFCERATPIGRGLLEKKYIFQVCACDEDGQQHFRNLSRLYPGLRFVYVYGWDGWNEYSYGSYLICRGHIRSYRVPVRVVEKALVKHGVDDNPNDEWPYQPEIDAETELMDLAEARWKKWLLRRNTPR